MKINFITSNKGKVVTLKKAFKSSGIEIDVEQQTLDIVEPQANDVATVSKNKALQAYKILNEPVVVEDGGFCIDALKGFPGVYTRYILDTIGAEGLLKLMKNETNRSCKFISYTTYIDENGELFQFETDNIATLSLTDELVKVNCEEAWSDIWHICKIDELNKTLAEAKGKDWNNLKAKHNFGRDSITKFVDWFKTKHYS
mgnify:CR=1 FL=1